MVSRCPATHRLGPDQTEPAAHVAAVELEGGRRSANPKLRLAPQARWCRRDAYAGIAIGPEVISVKWLPGGAGVPFCGSIDAPLRRRLLGMCELGHIERRSPRSTNDLMGGRPRLP